MNRDTHKQQRAGSVPTPTSDLGLQLFHFILAEQRTAFAWHLGTELPPPGFTVPVLVMVRHETTTGVWVPMLGHYSVGRAMWHVDGPDGNYDVRDTSRIRWRVLPPPPTEDRV